MKKGKKTIIKIQADDNGTWCDTCGTIMELMTGYLALTENLIEGLLKQGKEGEILLKVLLAEVDETFKENGVKVEQDDE